MKKIILLICIFICSDIFASAMSYEAQMRYLLIQRNIVEVEISSYKVTRIEDYKKHKVEVTGRILTVYRGDKKLLGRFFHISAFWTVFGVKDESLMRFSKGERHIFFVESIDKDGKLELSSIGAAGYGRYLRNDFAESQIIETLKNDKRAPFEMIRVQPYPPRKY